MNSQPSSPTPSLEEAMRFHQSGRTAEAEALFREILRNNPANSAALHALANSPKRKFWQKRRL